ncbi:hypothetical protein BH09VER1_BH09VER1_24960 [soil metagenome]
MDPTPLPPAEALIADYLRKLRNAFYLDDDKKFHQQKAMLVEGITYLAGWLKKREARLPDRRYRAILDEIIKGIMHHGDTAKIGYFCRYWLKAVQTHVDHHGDDYFVEAKDFRNSLDLISDHLTAKQLKKREEASDDTTDQLARLAKLVKGGRPKGSGKKKPASLVVQPSLF